MEGFGSFSKRSTHPLQQIHSREELGSPPPSRLRRLPGAQYTSIGGALAPGGSDVQMNPSERSQGGGSSSSSAGVAVPPPPPLTPGMKDELAVSNSIRVLSPRIVAVLGPTGTGKSTVFPLAVALDLQNSKDESRSHDLRPTSENSGM